MHALGTGIADLNRGTFEGRRILDPASYDLLWHPHFATGDEDKEEGYEHVGLGWFMGEYRGHRLIGHSGGDIGYNTDYVMLPDRSAAVVAMSNSVIALAWAAKLVVLDLLLGLEPDHYKRPVHIPLWDTLTSDSMDAAIEHYHQLKETQPDAFDFGGNQFGDLGMILNEMKRHGEAAEVYRLYAFVHPDSDYPWGALAWTCLRNEDPESALQYAQKALQLNPEHSDAEEVLADLSEAG